MLKWIAKKFIISKVNGLLNEHQGNVSKVRETLKLWTMRIKSVLLCFESLLSKLDDNIITTEELKQTADEVTELVKGWQ